MALARFAAACRRLGLNQEQFWTQIGVTQSGGSRYESGRDMPKPVRELLRVLVGQTDISVVPDPDVEGTFTGELKNVTLRQALDRYMQALMEQLHHLHDSGGHL